MRVRWLLGTVLVMLAVPTTSRAYFLSPGKTFGPLPVFEESEGPGGVIELELGSNELTLRYDPTTNATGGIYGFGELVLVGLGDVSLTDFTCTHERCWVGSSPWLPGKNFAITGGDIIEGEFSLQDLGVLSVEVTGPGGVALLYANFFDAEWGMKSATPMDIAVFRMDGLFHLYPHTALPSPRPTFSPDNLLSAPEAMPEPTSALLLSFGIAGVVLLRRVRGKNGAGARR